MFHLLFNKAYRKMREMEKQKRIKLRSEKISSQTEGTSSGTSVSALSHQPDTNNNPKSFRDRRRRCPKHSGRSRANQPHIAEVILVLFVMFGIPISYIVYKKAPAVYTYFMGSSDEANITSTLISATSSSSLPVEKIADDSLFSFKPWSYDFEAAQNDRLNKMKDYTFPFDLTSIDRRKNLGVNEFRDIYDGKWPVIISDCVSKWPAFDKWDVDYFNKTYGKEFVTMTGVHQKLSLRQQLIMPLYKFLNHLDDGMSNSYTYLMDELFIIMHPELTKDLGTCPVLEENYFSYFPKDLEPWWAFFLWGTRFSRSTTHIDPYNWTGTNAVIRGLKRWKLYPPGQDHLISTSQISVNKFPLKSPIYSCDVDGYDSNSVEEFPKIKEAKVIEFYQYPGELLIIPTGWYHQAFNEQPTLAVAGQLMNTQNYRIILEEIFKVNEISRDGYPSNMESLPVHQQVQLILANVKKEVLEQGKQHTKNTLDEFKRIKSYFENIEEVPSPKKKPKSQRQKNRHHQHTDL